jgi:hypothetical protein
MFFLIRCVFWLSVVFSTIFSQEQVRRPPVAPASSPAQTAQRARIDALTRNWVDAAASLIERQALARCARTDCVKSADAAAAHFLAARPLRQGWIQAEATVPLPPHRPAFAAQKMRRMGLEKMSRAEYVIEHSRRG